MKTTIKMQGNRDTGSLHLGKVNASVGDTVQVKGEQRTRTISYLAPTRDGGKVAYFRGSGPLPLGDVEVELITKDEPAPKGEQPKGEVRKTG